MLILQKELLTVHNKHAIYQKTVHLLFMSLVTHITLWKASNFTYVCITLFAVLCIKDRRLNI